MSKLAVPERVTRDTHSILCCLGRTPVSAATLGTGYEYSFSVETEVCPRKTTWARRRCGVSRGRQLAAHLSFINSRMAGRFDHVISAKTLRGFPPRCASRRVARPASSRRLSDSWESVLWSRCSCAAVFSVDTSARRSKPPLESGRTSASWIECVGSILVSVNVESIPQVIDGFYNFRRAYCGFGCIIDCSQIGPSGELSLPKTRFVNSRTALYFSTRGTA